MMTISEGWQRQNSVSDTLPTYTESYLRDIFSNEMKAVLIPSKRQLDFEKTIETQESIRPTGEGILNYLFSARTQNPSSTRGKQLKQIVAAFEQILPDFHFDTFSTDGNKVILNFSKGEGNWLPARHCGLGLQEVLMILYFSLASEYNLILYEEPETHLHPDIQRRLFLYLEEFAQKQFVFSTHSNVLISTVGLDSVFLSRFDNGIKIEEVTSKATLLASLGYSIADNLTSDLIILVEGSTDVPVINAFLEKMGLASKYNIKIWPLGGDMMAQLDLKVFTESYRVVALIDRDPGSDNVRNNFSKVCDDLGIDHTRLKKRTIENYFSLRALKAVLKETMPQDILTLDDNKLLKEQIGFDVKRSNRKIAAEMTLDEIKGTDLYAFLEKIGGMLEGEVKAKAAI